MDRRGTSKLMRESISTIAIRFGDCRGDHRAVQHDRGAVGLWLNCFVALLEAMTIKAIGRGKSVTTGSVCCEA